MLNRSPCFSTPLVSGSALALAIATSILSLAATAQESKPRTLEEIIITARKDVTMAQSTAVAVSAVTEDQMRLSQIVDLSDLQRTAPNLTISTGGPGASTVVAVGLRGQTSLNGTMTSDPAIATYVDGVYIARPHASLAEMIDMQRVEVLRGPQGTLFGRNTTGGALLLTTNQPSNTLGGSIEAQLGNFDHREVTGVINIPLTDDIATRLVYQHSEHGGYGDNDFLDTEVNDKENDFIRGTFQYHDPSGVWELTLKADYTKTKSNGQLAVLAGSPGNPDEASAGFPLLVPNGSSLAREFFTFNGLDLNDYLNANNDFWTNFSNEDEFFEFEGRGFSASFSADLDWAEFKYIGAWRDVDNKGLNDSDGTPLRLLTTTLHNEQDQWSHEFQLNGSGDIISWIAGASWFQEEATELTNSINYAGSFGTLRAVAAGVPIPGLAYDPSFISLLEAASENNGDVTNTSKGVFGQIYIDLTDTVKLTTGARYTLDTREVVLKNLDNKGNCINASNDTVGVCRQSRKTDFDYWSYLVGIDWQATEDVFLYAKTSQSYLAGGFNNRGGAEPAFDPEKVRDVELGAKLDWLNGRLRTNITLFKAEQEAIQRPISVFVNGQPSTFISNAGSTTIQGAEFELEALLWEGMTVSTTIGMMDSEYDKFTETRGTVDAPIIVDRSNEEVIQAPDLTYSISATQEIPLAIGLLTLHADYSYSDDVVLVTQTATPGSSAEITQIYADSNKAATIESYSLINAKASLAIRDSGWTVDIWGRNLGGEEYYARTFADLYTTPLSFAVSYPADPRTYGITARYEF